LKRLAGEDLRFEVRPSPPFFEKRPGCSPGPPFARSLFPFLRRF
jgi:hypothetical protein